MFLHRLSLQNFRSYDRAQFNFGKQTTLVVGPNTAGKTNLIEAIVFLVNGKSFRAEKDSEAIQFGKELARIRGKTDEGELEVVLTTGFVQGVKSPLHRFLVNGVSKRRIDFAGNLLATLFSPVDLAIVVDSPGTRRRFLDTVIEQVDFQYRYATTVYAKALRQRNALLDHVRETGVRNERMFEYWDKLLIDNGSYITNKRAVLLSYINNIQKDVFDLRVSYDQSIISQERLLQYKAAEVASGNTLVGPHRDDFFILMKKDSKENVAVKLYGSRGQQRLAVLQLKMLELLYIEKTTGKRPLLLLDDIFSELDQEHIQLVIDMLGKQQTIMTTTHREFVPGKLLKAMDVIKLG